MKIREAFLKMMEEQKSDSQKIVVLQLVGQGESNGFVDSVEEDYFVFTPATMEGERSAKELNTNIPFASIGAWSASKFVEE